MIIAHNRPLRPSSSFKTQRLNVSLYIAFGLVAIVFSGCVQPSAPYRLLSDEVIGMIAAPPYSAKQVKQAQITLRRRGAARLSESVIQSQLKGFACLIVSQQLDPTSARGERAPSELPCSFDSKQRCAHRCKRSRLPIEIKLPQEYNDVANRHDEIIWDELNRVAESDVNPQWESYLTQCLECKRSHTIKRRVCLRDVDGVELTAVREPHSPLDRWLNQCSSLRDPEIQALTNYRKLMLTPPEDIPYPSQISKLSEGLQDKLTTRAAIGQGIRLLAGSLDEKRISELLYAEEKRIITDERWIIIQERLRRRLDAPLMPCLEHGLDTCVTVGQIGLAREQARRYLEECKLCEHREEIERWREVINLGLEPVWKSQDQRSVQVALRHQSPSALLINEDQTISRFKLNDSPDHLVWKQTLSISSTQSANEQTKLNFWPPRPRGMAPP